MSLWGWLQSRFNDPLEESKPDIEFMRWTESYTTMAFAARSSFSAAGKLASLNGQISIRTTDGEVFSKYGSEQKWQGPEKYGQEGFYSAYLDNWVEHALNNGLEKQSAAYDIYRGMTGRNSMRMQIIWSGSDEEFSKIDEDYPSPPTGFGTGHDAIAPEDYAEEHPHFAAYLVNRNWHPWRPELNGHGPKPSVEDSSVPKVKKSLPQ